MIRLAGFVATESLEWMLQSSDPLRFPGYREEVAAAAEPCDAAVGLMAGMPVVGIDLDFDRLGGTMGTVVGEVLVRAFDHATEQGLPVVASVSSGGARIQEGMLSLIQMTRTIAAVGRHRAAGLLSVGVLRSPTTGGVYASWSSHLSVRAGVAHALLGFGGPRVVEHVTGQLPGALSHSAEAAAASGLLDAVITPDDEAAWVASVLGAVPTPIAIGRRRRFSRDAASAGRAGWDLVQHARRRDRPSGVEWAAALTTSWVELAASDPVVRTGIATIRDRRAVVIALDRHAYNDGAARPGPAGFRQARRAVALASALRLPILTLIDTTGAEPGPASELGGVAHEIAGLMWDIGAVDVPTVGLCVGEGGSGGAMAFGNTDRLYMLDDAFFSVISPEAAAIVLEREAAQAPRLSGMMAVSADELVELGTIDGGVPWIGDDDIEKLVDLVLASFDEADVTRRNRRPDRATARALSATPVGAAALADDGVPRAS